MEKWQVSAANCIRYKLDSGATNAETQEWIQGRFGTRVIDLYDELRKHADEMHVIQLVKNPTGRIIAGDLSNTNVEILSKNDAFARVRLPNGRVVYQPSTFVVLDGKAPVNSDSVFIEGTATKCSTRPGLDTIGTVNSTIIFPLQIQITSLSKTLLKPDALWIIFLLVLCFADGVWPTPFYYYHSNHEIWRVSRFDGSKCIRLGDSWQSESEFLGKLKEVRKFTLPQIGSTHRITPVIELSYDPESSKLRLKVSLFPYFVPKGDETIILEFLDKDGFMLKRTTIPLSTFRSVSRDGEQYVGYHVTDEDYMSQTDYRQMTNVACTGQRL